MYILSKVKEKHKIDFSVLKKDQLNSLHQTDLFSVYCSAFLVKVSNGLDKSQCKVTSVGLCC